MEKVTITKVYFCTLCENQIRYEYSAKEYPDKASVRKAVIYAYDSAERELFHLCTRRGFEGSVGLSKFLGVLMY